SIVRSKQDQRILSQPRLFHRLYDPPHIPIEPGDHGGEVFIPLRPGFFRIWGIIWYFIFSMRGRQGEVKKKWIFLFLIRDVRDGFVDEQVVAVSLLSTIAIFRQQHLFFIFPQNFRVIGMSLYLIQVSKGVIESLMIGSQTRTAQSPFSDDRGLVSGLAEILRHGLVSQWNGEIFIAIGIEISTDKSVAGVPAC